MVLNFFLANPIFKKSQAPPLLLYVTITCFSSVITIVIIWYELKYTTFNEI